MLNFKIETRLIEAALRVLSDADPSLLKIRPCPNPKFGDFQTTGLMPLAKRRGLNPREVAEEVIRNLDVSQYCSRVEVAGPGFLNFHVKKEAIEEVVSEAARGEHIFSPKAEEPKTIVIDFSSPNVAKPMHVGHIRSTILGDCLARLFRFLGHKVITDNHIGDWGTQFGKLIVGWKTRLDTQRLENDPVGEMERIYREINSECERAPSILESARGELVKLQNNDPENIGIWRRMIELSRHQFESTYHRLGVEFDHMLGESFYNSRLNNVIAELQSADVVRESRGALVAFFDEDPILKEHPAIVRKSDGAANYTTTDLATLDYRVREWGADKIVYVTDSRQQLHFRQIFKIFEAWRREVETEMVHVWFGSILGEDGKPFKTRSGEVVRLSELLDEAEERAQCVVEEKNPGLTDNEKERISRIVGIGAIKYADLLPNRQSDYQFSWDKMLALNGNTAPYLLYAYARIRSIFRKSGDASAGELGARDGGAARITLATPEEVALARQLSCFGMTLEAVAEDYRPNYLCNYIYELAGFFTQFYEKCPVLKAEPEIRRARLRLCGVTAEVLKTGLEILGLEVPEQM
ncbi:MAG: arginine--tRNA ligase [Verrucomicrobia bacterium]|nr:arginine--tRNA ligase [Verrucomicrobiota bacterium]MCF7709226.1 arginine--tRNA ligase [Verrucomicrobiota bacterium]